MTRRKAMEDLRGLAHAELLRRCLAPLRASQRGRALPPEPPAEDRARYASATPRERARAGVLLQRAGFTGADVARGVALLAGEAPAEGAPDDVTRKRARVLLRGAR